jgi:hypothetical protein
MVVGWIMRARLFQVLPGDSASRQVILAIEYNDLPATVKANSPIPTAGPAFLCVKNCPLTADCFFSTIRRWCGRIIPHAAVANLGRSCMSKSFDALMKILEQKGAIPDEDAAKVLKENGPLTDEEKKQVAAAIKMKKALTKSDDKKDDKDKDAKKEEKKDDKPADKDKKAGEEVTLDDYLQALSVLDSDDSSKEDKEKAQKAKDKFESQ